MNIFSAPEVEWLLESGTGEGKRLVAVAVGHLLGMKPKRMSSTGLKLIGFILPSQSFG